MKNKTILKLKDLILSKIETCKVKGGNSKCATCHFERGVSGRSASNDPNINN